jgi:enoyl-CoA hydratase
LLGRTVSAQEAHSIGLVHRVAERDVLAEAIAFTKEFSSYSLIALGLAREAVTRAFDVPVYEGLKIEADLSTLAFGTADAEEGMAAFSEKRQAKFKDE